MLGVVCKYFEDVRRVVILIFNPKYMVQFINIRLVSALVDLTFN